MVMEEQELRQTDEYAKYMQALGWRVEIAGSGIRAYVKRVPILPWWLIKIQRVRLMDVNEAFMAKLARKYRCLVMYLELVDGNKVINDEKVRYRVAPLGEINSFYFSTFHGGNTPAWAPKKDSYIYFDDIKVSREKPENLH